MKVQLYQGNFLEKMQEIQDHSVHLIAVDLPYGVSNSKWDNIIPFKEMWEQFYRVLTTDGNIVLTATQPFTSKLIMSNLGDFKYEVIWEKTIGSGQLSIKRQPLKVHESILIFYKKLGTYNEQKTLGESYTRTRKVNFKGEGYGKQVDSEKKNDGYRHARSVVKIPNARYKGGHPTQKPVSLMEYIIKTYSNENDIVLDCCMGSGTTGVATCGLKRNFIGIELDSFYFEMAKTRIEEANG